jgi:hypothetical protein
VALLGIVEANWWEMSPLHELLPWKWIAAVAYWPYYGYERNMIDHRTVDMIDGAVHEIMEHAFQDLELATRDKIVGSMPSYRN